MSRKMNKRFIWIGALGFALLFALGGLNGLMFFIGFDNRGFQALLRSLTPFVVFPSFVSLICLGIMPLLLTKKLAKKLSILDNPCRDLSSYHDSLAELKSYNFLNSVGSLGLLVKDVPSLTVDGERN
jgi:hypothetical protein